MRDSIVNTLYFNVSQFDPTEGPDYQGLVDDLYDGWQTSAPSAGRYLDIRAYNMEDDEPREPRAFRRGQIGGVTSYGVRQVALCLSYYADRNLPRHRGRIYVGPWPKDAMGVQPTPTIMQQVLDMTNLFADLGGLNVDWSLWSPTTNTHTRVSDAWVDNSWDIIRSRKVAATSRISKTLNG